MAGIQSNGTAGLFSCWGRMRHGSKIRRACIVCKRFLLPKAWRVHFSINRDNSDLSDNHDQAPLVNIANTVLFVTQAFYPASPLHAPLISLIL